MQFMRVGLISDTHGFLHSEVLILFSNVDLILHAGDIGGEDIITGLETLAPVKAVAGNMDGFPLAGRYPEVLTLDIEGHTVYLVHKPPRSNSDFAKEKRPEIVIHGHTHHVRNEKRGGILYLNPGSAGNARVAHNPTVMLVEINKNTDIRVEIIQIARLP